MNEVLNISEIPSYDESISNKSFHTYHPFIESYNNSDTIRICIQNQDLVLLPSESVLYVEGSLHNKEKKADDVLQLNNNCVPFMFDEIRYELNGIEIDRSRNVGITTALKNYISLNSNESSSLLNAGWSLKEENLSAIEQFNFCVPLKRLLGFAEDFRKVIPNAKHELILIRANTDNNAVKTSLLNYSLNISKITWKVPHILLSDNERLNMYTIIQSLKPLQIAFRSWDLFEYPNVPKSTHTIWRIKTANQLEKPRFIIFALQVNKVNNLGQNPSKFDHCQLSNFKAYLNSEYYPYENLNISYNENRYSWLYHMYSMFQESYYGCNSLPLLDSEKFKSLAPIIVIDCSHQNENIKTGPVDVKIEFETSANGIQDNTTAYCLLLHERRIEYFPLSGDVRKLI